MFIDEYVIEVYIDFYDNSQFKLLFRQDGDEEGFREIEEKMLKGVVFLIYQTEFK